jgi:hypothetical protein
MKKEKKDNRAVRDNKSVITSEKGKKTISKSSTDNQRDFEKSKIRNKGKGSNANLGGSLSDHDKKKKLP